MKKQLLFLVLVFSGIVSFAQLVTISGTNQIPQIGQEISYYNINTFGFTLSGTPDGINTIWNYSTLTVNDEVVFSYSDASLAEGHEDFPTANIAEAVDGVNGLMFYQTGNYYMARKGATGDMFINYATDSALLFNFPITAGENSETNYTGIISASGLDMDIPDGNVEITADAQGTITLPNGTTLTNVLRLNVKETFSGMYDMGTGPMEVMSVEDDYYYWYHEDYTAAIMIYGNTLVESIGGNEETEVLRYQPIVLSENQIVKENNSSLIYPTISNGEFNIVNSQDFNTGRILDLNGKEIRKFKPESKIDLTDLNNGAYFILLYGENGPQMVKAVIQK